jgi:hypothetical protein
MQSFVAAMLSLVALSAQPASLILTPAADTTMIEVAPTNSNGGQDFFNTGTTQNGTRNRGIMRFDLDSLPANAVILSASVVISVVKLPAEPAAAAPFSLHRMFRDWGEGTNTGILNIGQGSPASPGDATWTHAQFNTNAWAAPGGVPGVDFAGFESGSAFIYDIGGSPYTLGPTAELAADVQDWTQNPASNFGWLFLCDDEATRFTAKRFGARENPNPDARPQLILSYLIPPHVDRTELNGPNFLLGFRAEAGHTYNVECRDALDSGAWQPLADLGFFATTTQVQFLDPATHGVRFYRLSAF